MDNPVGDRLTLEVEAVIDLEPTPKDCNCGSSGTSEVALLGEDSDRKEFIMKEEANEVVTTPEEAEPLEDKAGTDIEPDPDGVTRSPPECIE